MRFELLILGCNSALPAHGRHPSAQAVNHNERIYLIDCGEGTQMRLDAFRVKRSRLDVIFISHLHGDHVFGLPGLLTSLNLQGRTECLLVFGPFGLQAFITTALQISGSVLSYELHVTEMDPSVPHDLYENSVLRVRSFPLRHRVPTMGFLFEEKTKDRRIKTEALERYGIPYQAIAGLRRGEDYLLPDGGKVANQAITDDPAPVRRYAYCSDTVYDVSLADVVKGVDLLYHEATFLSDMAAQAADRMHATAAEAAQTARDAGVRQLVIGHFSSRYKHLEPLLREARSVFPDTELAEEGRVFAL